MTLADELRALASSCPAVMHPDKWRPLRDALIRAADRIDATDAELDRLWVEVTGLAKALEQVGR